MIELCVEKELVVGLGKTLVKKKNKQACMDNTRQWKGIG